MFPPVLHSISNLLNDVCFFNGCFIPGKTAIVWSPGCTGQILGHWGWPWGPQSSRTHFEEPPQSGSLASWGVGKSSEWTRSLGERCKAKRYTTRPDPHSLRFCDIFCILKFEKKLVALAKTAIIWFLWQNNYVSPWGLFLDFWLFCLPPITEEAVRKFLFNVSKASANYHRQAVQINMWRQTDSTLFTHKSLWKAQGLAWRQRRVTF